MQLRHANDMATTVVVLPFKNLRWRPWFWAWDIRPGTCLTWQSHINCYIICNVEDEVVLKVIIIADVLPMFRFWWWYGPESVRLYPAQSHSSDGGDIAAALSHPLCTKMTCFDFPNAHLSCIFIQASSLARRWALLCSVVQGTSKIGSVTDGICVFQLPM